MSKLKATFAAYAPLLTQLFRFVSVGVTAAAVHFTTVVWLVQTNLLLPLTANVVGFLLSFQVSYWGHRSWTFNETTVLHRAALPKLLLVQVLNFIANESLFFWLLSLHIPYALALIVVLAILPLFTFFISKLWVFAA